MPEKKMNWGTLILGIIIGAIVVGVVWMASKPQVGGAVGPETATCLRSYLKIDPEKIGDGQPIDTGRALYCCNVFRDSDFQPPVGYCGGGGGETTQQ